MVAVPTVPAVAHTPRVAAVAGPLVVAVVAAVVIGVGAVISPDGRHP